MIALIVYFLLSRHQRHASAARRRVAWRGVAKASGRLPGQQRSLARVGVVKRPVYDVDHGEATVHRSYLNDLRALVQSLAKQPTTFWFSHFVR